MGTAVNTNCNLLMALTSSATTAVSTAQTVIGRTNNFDRIRAMSRKTILNSHNVNVLLQKWVNPDGLKLLYEFRCLQPI